MKYIAIILISFLSIISIYAQSSKEFSRNIFSKEISFVRTDSTHGSQSTIIEYPDFLVVIELPMINEGGGRSTNLVEDIPKSERFLNYLKEEYNNKPIKYVMTSHWHCIACRASHRFLTREQYLFPPKQIGNTA